MRIVTLVTGCLLASCGSSVTNGPGDGGDDPGDTPGSGVQVHLTGAVQKGPFVQGSSVTVSLLDASGNPTGAVFPTQTMNNLGEFSLDITAPVGQWVSLEGNGYYYNEVTGEVSHSGLTQRAFYKIQAGGAQHAVINVITHLSYNRIRTLVQAGSDFEAAVSQAEAELRSQLGVGLEGFDPGVSGTAMNILGGDTPANTYLLAVSATLVEAAVLLPGASLEGKLQELVNTLSLDLAPDGQIGAESRALLRAAAAALDPDDVMRKLATRLAGMGSGAEVPDLNEILDSDFDGQVNAEDCLPRDPKRWTGHADYDTDGHDAASCGGDDCDDDCATCYPGAVAMGGDGLDHDCDGRPDDRTLGLCPGASDWSIADHFRVADQVGVSEGWWVVVRDYLYGCGGVTDISSPDSPTTTWDANRVLFQSPVLAGANLVFPPGWFYSQEGPEQVLGVVTWDISDPTAITEHVDERSMWTDLGVETRACASSGSYLYCQAGDESTTELFAIFDMTDPVRVAPVGPPIAAPECNQRDGVFVRDGRAYYITLAGTLVIIDVSDPTAPRVVSEGVSLQHPFTSLFVDASAPYAYLLLAGGDPSESGLWVASLADADNPVLVAGPIAMPEWNEIPSAFWAAAGTGLLATYGGTYQDDTGTFPEVRLYRLDLSDPTQVQIDSASKVLAMSYASEGDPDLVPMAFESIFVSGRHIALGNGGGGSGSATVVDLTCTP